MPERRTDPTPALPVDGYEDAMAALSAWHQRDYETCFEILAVTHNVGETAACAIALAGGLLRLFTEPDAVLQDLGDCTTDDERAEILDAQSAAIRGRVL